MTPGHAMKDWAELIRSIAFLLWPILAFVVLFLLKHQIRDILGRLRRGKVLGQKIELEQSLRELNASAQAAASESPLFVQVPDIGKAGDVKDHESDDLARRVIEEASKSPKIALILLASELEREVRQLLASMGLLGTARSVSLFQYMQILEERGALPNHLAGSVRNFWYLRNKLVHGHEASPDDIVRAIDSGLTILRTIRAIPHEVNVVYHPGAEVYADAEGREVRPGIKAVVLQTTSPGGAKKTLRAHPTTRTQFQKGDRVAWEWNRHLVVGESWYRHPDTSEVAYGWTQSVEFVGRHLEDV
jgi:hypothetical protein